MDDRFGNTLGNSRNQPGLGTCIQQAYRGITEEPVWPTHCCSTGLRGLPSEQHRLRKGGCHRTTQSLPSSGQGHQLLEQGSITRRLLPIVSLNIQMLPCFSHSFLLIWNHFFSNYSGSAWCSVYLTPKDSEWQSSNLRRVHHGRLVARKDVQIVTYIVTARLLQPPFKLWASAVW